MRIWRVSNFVDLSGRGGLVYAGRWNELGTPVVYCSDHPATALLETLARIDREDVPSRFNLLSIDVPDELPTVRLDPDALSPDWQFEPDKTRQIGTDLLDRSEHALVLVPCVLVPYAWNVLLNPRFPSAHRCSIIEVIEVGFDPRLLR